MSNTNANFSYDSSTVQEVMPGVVEKRFDTHLPENQSSG